MAKYRKIDPRIWNDAKFRSMTDRGKLAFFFLLTHPHMTSIGAMRTTVVGLAAEIGWPEKAFRQAFGEAVKHGMVLSDEQACMVMLPNFLRYNTPESPNVVKSWVGAFDLLPECDLKERLFLSAEQFVESLHEGFAKAFAEVFRKALPIQEQEQEQEPKQEQEQEPIKKKDGPETAKPSGPAVLIFPCDGVVDQWGLTAEQTDEWQSLYPNIDVAAECRKALAWIKANRDKQKTANGMSRFLVRWLNKATDNVKPASTNGHAKPEQPRKSGRQIWDEIMAAEAAEKADEELCR